MPSRLPCFDFKSMAQGVCVGSRRYDMSSRTLSSIRIVTESFEKIALTGDSPPDTVLRRPPSATTDNSSARQGPTRSAGVSGRSAAASADDFAWAGSAFS